VYRLAGSQHGIPSTRLAKPLICGPERAGLLALKLLTRHPRGLSKNASPRWPKMASGPGGCERCPRIGCVEREGGHR
jgi:hypothetical protein